MNAKAIREEELPKQEQKEDLDEEERNEIKEIGKNPIDMSTWKEERIKAVEKKREKQGKSEKE